MEQGQDFDVVIRKVTHSSRAEEVYRVTLFKRIESMDELLIHPRIATLIRERVVRLEKIDNFRFKIFLGKTPDGEIPENSTPESLADH